MTEDNVQEDAKLIVVEERRREELPAPIVEANPLMQIIARAAADPHYDVAKLQALLQVKREWEQDEARKAFAVALAKFKENPPEIIKTRQVDYVNKAGTRTKYKHATLGAVSAAVGEGLGKVGIAHRWSYETLEDKRIKVTCTLTHALGHSESVSLSALPDDSGGKNSIQAVGSTTEYLRRYTLLGAAGVASHDQDDDGQGGGDAHAMDDKEKAEWLAQIEVADSQKAAEALWAQIADRCSKVGDIPAYDELKKAAWSRIKELKKLDTAAI